MVMKPVAQYDIPKEPGRWRAITLAVAVHGALLLMLWIGVRWQNETPLVVEAEVWSPQVREAAPTPQPQPEVKELPKPVPVKVPEPVIPPKPVEKIAPVIKPPVIDPEIALEQEKKRKAELLKERLEEERQEKLKKQAKEKQLAQEKQDKLDAKEKLEKQAKLDAKEKQDKQDKLDKLAKQEAQEKADLKKAELDKKRKQDEADNKRLAKIREDEMKRIAGVAVGPGGSGDAPKSQGPRGDPSYNQKVGAKIRSNTVFNGAEDVEGNPSVEYAVDLLPDGTVRGMRKLKTSGIPGFDEAVRRAIEKSQPFPADKSGTVPSGIILTHKPKD
jgi:colicin import membrane protein